MDELLNALQDGDDEEICRLALELFRRASGQPNKCQINEFEHYAPCQITLIHGSHSSTIIGAIQYNNKSYMFG